MQTNVVYQCEAEVDRLATQSKLFKEYEDPVYEAVLSQYVQTRILDIGSNNGIKTVDRFCRPEVTKVLGLEYHQDLAEQAQARYGDQRFSFYGCDVEAEGFYQRLIGLMASQEIEEFDVIHISLVLLHLHRPTELLEQLHKVLSPQGQLLIVESADHVSQLVPDETGLCQGFLQALSLDPYSGNRDLGRCLPELLPQCGFTGHL